MDVNSVNTTNQMAVMPLPRPAFSSQGSAEPPGGVTSPVVAPYVPAPSRPSTLGGIDAPVITADAPAAAAHSSGEEPPYSIESLEQIVNQLNHNLTPFSREMNISVHEPTSRIMVEIRDTVADEVIREIPPEQMLDAFVAALEMHGLLYDQRG